MTNEIALRSGGALSRHEKRQSNHVILEDVRIRFRNFSGAEGQYNVAGNRNFVLLLEEHDADQLASQGWNVKYLKARDENEEPQPYIQVTVKYPRPETKQRPPQAVLVSSRGKNPLAEEDINILDWVEIERVDVSIRPYDWEVNGNKGRKAYLQSIYVHIVEDELDLKYADVPLESAQMALTPIEGDADEEVVFAELVED